MKFRNFFNSQVPRRSSRRRVREIKTKKWAERSVWNMVCAMELGLVQPGVIRNVTWHSRTTKNKRENVTNVEYSRTKEKFKKDIFISQFQDFRIQEHDYSLRPLDLPNECVGRRSMNMNSDVEIEELFSSSCHEDSNVDMSFSPDKNSDLKKVARSLNYPKNLKVAMPFSPDNNAGLKKVARSLNYPKNLKVNTSKFPETSATFSNYPKDLKVHKSLNFDTKPRPKKVTRSSTSKIKTSKFHEKSEPEVAPSSSFRKHFKFKKSLNFDIKPKTKKKPRSSRHSSNIKLKKFKSFLKPDRKKIREYSEDSTTSLDLRLSPVKKVKYSKKIFTIDETLSIDPSTDLPGSLMESVDDTGVDLKPEFDLNNLFNFDDSSSPILSCLSEQIVNGINESFSSSEDSLPLITKKRKKLTKKSSETIKKPKEISTILGLRKRISADDSIIMSCASDKENDPMMITRGSLKNAMVLTDSNSQQAYPVGTIVWGNCTGWWPALIISGSEVGMSPTAGKIWVYWLGEYRISNLREKTQIQPFSTSIRSRMIETLRSKSHKDPNHAACLATINLINDQILHLGLLKKPYHAWVEKHIISLENIDRLILQPYPPIIKNRLDELQRDNLAATEKYLSDSKKKENTKSNTNLKQIVPKDPGSLPLMSQKPGVITWAKIMGQIWWPAMIIDFRDCGQKEPSFGCQWIMWYGDNTLSQVNHNFFLEFEKGIARMKSYVLNCKRELYKRGVLDAARDYCSQFGYKTSTWTIEEAFAWFSKSQENSESNIEFNGLPGIPGIQNPGENSRKYSAKIVEGLKKHKGNCTIAAIREYNIKDSDDLRDVVTGKIHLNSLCLMCLKTCCKTKKNMDHPFFEGQLCEECSEKYIPTIFAYGDDGKCFFCTVCAGSDTVVMCDEHDCPRVFCTACLKYLIAPVAYDEIILNDPWICFVCERNANLMKGGILNPRRDSKDRVAALFQSNHESVPSQMRHYRNGKKRMRVLSLFDGIGTGLFVLKKLGIDVEVYYSSEIDPDAELVSSVHFGDEIIRLGDVRGITEEKIKEISPIDLLIGGSPCNDLSLVNPMRLGLHDPNGTGVLFFDFVRVRELIEKNNRGRHFFWMFENVASMPSKYRVEINERLGRTPDLIDSANYSAQHRPRLYWSNLPSVSFPISSEDLQDVLTPNCNRHALVKKIRTVTTRVNSLKQSKSELKPILMNGDNDGVWITELEQIFGFSRHYTDVRNLCATKRLKLIGRAWSVQTIVEIFRPLRNFFVSDRETA